MSFWLVPKSVTLNDLERRRLMAVTLRYFTEFGKPAVQHMPQKSRHLCSSLLCFVIRARCRRKESSRSLSHFPVSFFYLDLNGLDVLGDHCLAIAYFLQSSLSFLANVNSCSCSLYVVVRPSVVCCLSVVCRLSVTFVHSTQSIEIFGNVYVPFNMDGDLTTSR